jgi:branched-chain amino acid transport system substrate-binding protein
LLLFFKKEVLSYLPERRSMLHRRKLIATAACLPFVARAAPRPVVKIGVLTDLSGPYRDIAGQASIACTRLAATECGTADFDVQVISADHRNDVANGAAIAARWYDHEGVDLIVDVPNSNVALAVSAVAREKNRAFIDCGAGTTLLTGAQCSPNTIHWGYNTDMLARSTGGALVHGGGATWFFLTQDTVFGRGLEADTSATVVAAGGRVEGSLRYTFPAAGDQTPLLRQAMQSGAAVLGLATAGTDLIGLVRQARALGLTDDMRIAGLLMLLPDVHALGLEAAGGLLLTESFYWDLNDRTRAFTKRLGGDAPPDMIGAACYAGTLHFLRAVSAMGVANARADAATIIARMKATPTDDDAFGPGSIRRDGQAMVPAYLFQVKSSSESNGPWDAYRLLSTTPADGAYGTLDASGCAIVKT